jgi:AmmeMemoRadiSam system protein B
MNTIRPPAVAGFFYPAEAGTLVRDVAAMLAEAEQAVAAAGVPKAIIAPHAGYVYSGPIAARAYATLQPARDRIRRVVLLGPTHRTPVRGLAVPAATAFASPLGTVAIDREAITSVADLPQVVMSDSVHAMEHSLEVHLPFLQSVLGTFTLVPFAVGRAAPEEVAEVLDRLWGGAETLIVVSSDLSHYLPYAVAREMDRETVDAILGLDAVIDHERACGGTPVNGLLLAARRHGLRPHLLDLRNSGDTAGDRHRVVGYCSIAFEETVRHDA